MLSKIGGVAFVNGNPHEPGVTPEYILTAQQPVHRLVQIARFIVLLMGCRLYLITDPLRHIPVTAHIAEMPAAVGHPHAAPISRGYLPQIHNAFFRQIGKTADLRTQPLFLFDPRKFPGNRQQIPRNLLHIQETVEHSLCQMIDLMRIKFPQDFLQRLRFRNLVHIAEDHDIVRPAGLQAADQLVLLEFIPLVSRHAAHGRIIHRNIDDLVLKLPEHFPVLRKEHFLLFPGKGNRRLLQHEFIHIRRQDLHSQL